MPKAQNLVGKLRSFIDLCTAFKVIFRRGSVTSLGLRSLRVKVTMMTDVQPLLSEGGLCNLFSEVHGIFLFFWAATSTHSFLLFSSKRQENGCWCWVEMPIRLVQKPSTVIPMHHSAGCWPHLLLMSRCFSDDSKDSCNSLNNFGFVACTSWEASKKTTRLLGRFMSTVQVSEIETYSAQPNARHTVATFAKTWNWLVHKWEKRAAVLRWSDVFWGKWSLKLFFFGRFEFVKGKEMRLSL